MTMAKKTTTEKLIAQQPDCTYCAGASKSTTRDHSPPITIFRLRDRPKGLEFGACAECHEGTRKMDLVVSVASRFQLDRSSQADKDELETLMREFTRRFPNLAGEFEDFQPILDGGRTVAYAVDIRDAHINIVMETFAARTAFSLFREIAGRALPANGAVAIRWFSNADAMSGNIPADFLKLLGNPATLKSGTKDMSSQFTYQFRALPNNEAMVFFVTFRTSFAFAAFAASDEKMIDSAPKEKLFRPGFLKGWSPPDGRGPNVRLLHRIARRAISEAWHPRPYGGPLRSTS